MGVALPVNDNAHLCLDGGWGYYEMEALGLRFADDRERRRPERPLPTAASAALLQNAPSQIKMPQKDRSAPTNRRSGTAALPGCLRKTFTPPVTIPRQLPNRWHDHPGHALFQPRRPTGSGGKLPPSLHPRPLLLLQRFRPPAKTRRSRRPHYPWCRRSLPRQATASNARCHPRSR